MGLAVRNLVSVGKRSPFLGRTTFGCVLGDSVGAALGASLGGPVRVRLYCLGTSGRKLIRNHCNACRQMVWINLLQWYRRGMWMISAIIPLEYGSGKETK